VSSVLFVCFGNICRSPFAAEAARSRLGGVAVASGGFHSEEGRPSPRHVVETARTLAVDMSACRSVRLTPERVAAADLIVCMDVANLRQLADEYPAALSRATLLGFFRPAGPAQINDPFGLSPATTRMVFVQILDALQSLSEWISIAPLVT
jgi:protein-tyrosine phosphatase